jgi:hypothetical protein
VANEIKVSSAVREAVAGDNVGKDIAADIISVSLEALTGDRYGLTVFGDAYALARETLTGDAYGLTVFGSVASSVREVLISDAPFKASTVVREVLCSIENDPLTVARIVTSYRQTVLTPRQTAALPSTVKSLQTVPTLREQVAQKATRVRPTSFRFAQTLRMQAAIHRNVLTAPQMHSFTRAYTFRQQIVLSRGKVYVPVSAVYTKAQRQMVVSHRVTTAPSQIRTPITVAGQRQVVLMSRRVQVVMTSGDVGAFAQQVVQKVTHLTPYSEVDSAELVQMIVQRHNVIAPGIDDRVATLREQVAIERTPTPPFGVEHAFSMRQQAVLARVTPMWRSTTRVASSVMLAIQHRDTYAPPFALGRHASTLRQHVVMHRQVGPIHGYSLVRTLRLTFTIKRDTPAPWDVIDPHIGRHTAQLRMLAVQHRPTIPPDVVRKESRYVFNAASQVAVGDSFPAPDYPPPIHETDVKSVGQVVLMRDASPWEPVSSVKSESVAESLVLGDAEGWIDATVPQSDVTAFGVVQQIAAGDEFPDSMLAQSDAVVALLANQVAVGDTSLPDPLVPASEISAEQVAEITALGDAQFPDPLIPLSDLRSCAVGAFCVLGDADLAGTFGMSEISTSCLAEVVVIPDRSLVGISLRKGPRPVISVSIS